jgi:DNA-binding transcriptional ArsR family regulator/precorrin-6B methylase 2
MDAVPQTLPRWDLYRALSEPVRLRALALAAEEELTVGELAELLGESQPNTSRYVAVLKQAGLLEVRRQGTRALVRAQGEADPVVADAIASGRALCEADGSLARVAEVLRARDAVGREYFARARGKDAAGPPSELGAYLAALAPLLPRRALAVDAGTGDGGLLDVLAPVFTRVVAVDRSEAQLALAERRVRARGMTNVKLVAGELAAPEVRRAVGEGADAVFAVRVLHHAPRPQEVVAALAALAAPGGAVLVIDYARHEDEAMREQADLWLGFEPRELRVFARAAGLEGAEVSPLPAGLLGPGPDTHLPWQLLVARRPENDRKKKPETKKGHGHG